MSLPDRPLPPSWFGRDDPTPDDRFYAVPRLVTHIDEGAVAAVTRLYADLGIDGAGHPRGRVLDLMSSWVSHLHVAPAELVVLGMNRVELDANPMATERVVHDLNRDPTLPFPDASFDAVLCCVSIDYLVRPVEVLTEVARVLVPGAPVVITFSNRCFPTKAVHAWLATDDAGHLAYVTDLLDRSGGFGPAETSRRTPTTDAHGRPYRGDPLFAVVARRHRDGAGGS